MKEMERSVELQQMTLEAKILQAIAGYRDCGNWTDQVKHWQINLSSDPCRATTFLICI